MSTAVIVASATAVVSALLVHYHNDGCIFLGTHACTVVCARLLQNMLGLVYLRFVLFHGMSLCYLRAFSFAAVFIVQDAQPGDYLAGSLTLADYGTSIFGSAKAPTGYPIRFTVTKAGTPSTGVPKAASSAPVAWLTML